MRYIRGFLAAMLMVWGGAFGCLADDSETAELIVEPLLELQSTCCASSTCSDGTRLDCTGTNSCYAAPDGPGTYVQCDGIKKYCPVVTLPGSSCVYKGRTYYDGQLTTEGRCVSGVCTGPCDWFPRPCTWNMHCKAVCDDGKWLCEL